MRLPSLTSVRRAGCCCPKHLVRCFRPSALYNCSKGQSFGRKRQKWRCRMFTSQTPRRRASGGYNGTAKSSSCCSASSAASSSRGRHKLKLGLYSTPACRRLAFTVSRICSVSLLTRSGSVSGVIGRRPLRITHWEATHSHDAELSCIYDSHTAGSSRPQILVVSPTMVDLPNSDVPAGVVLATSRHSAGVTLVSVCSGAFFLAETGVVQGVRFRRTPFMQRPWPSGFRTSLSIRTSASSTMATSSQRAGSWRGLTSAVSSREDFWRGGEGGNGSLRSFRSISEGGALFPRLRSSSGARRSSRAQGSGVGAHPGWTRLLSRLDGGGGGIGKAYVSPPVRQCNRNDADRILSSGS